METCVNSSNNSIAQGRGDDLTSHHPESVSEAEVAETLCETAVQKVDIAADEMKMEPSEIKIQKTAKLSGAGRKRHKWLLKHGHTPEKALELAMLHMPKPNSNNHQGTKRGRSDHSTALANTSKQLKISHTAELPRSVRTPVVHSKFAAGSVRLAVMSEDHPRSLITEEQLRTLEEAILDRVIELKGGAVKPKFLSSKYKTGFLILVCANNDTAEWLKTNFKEVKLWEGANVKLIDEKDFPQTQTITGRFPNSEESSTERILGLIEGQNEDLKVTSWRILRRDTDGQQKNWISKLCIGMVIFA